MFTHLRQAMPPWGHKEAISVIAYLLKHSRFLRSFPMPPWGHGSNDSLHPNTYKLPWNSRFSFILFALIKCFHAPMGA